LRQQSTEQREYAPFHDMNVAVFEPTLTRRVIAAAGALSEERFAQTIERFTETKEHSSEPVSH
jgi:hypothetical protein